MAIQPAEILYKLAVTTGPGNSTAQPDPNLSLGEFISTTAVSATALNNLFDNVTGDESSAGDTEYRCVFVHNSNASLTLQNPVLWLSAETAGGANLALGVDGTAASALASATAQAVEVVNESTAPAGVTFSTPTSKGTGLALGNIAAGNVKAFWVRRVVPAATAAANADGGTWRVEGDTAA